MRKLLSLTAGITIILSALCGLFIGIARLQPQQDLGQFECGDQPCLANIFVGQTTWADAQAIVQKYPPFKKVTGTAGNLEFESYIGTFNAASYLSIGSNNGNTVQSAQLIFHPPFQSIGSIIAYYGNPCRLRIFGGKQQVDLYYPRFVASLYLTQRFIANMYLTQPKSTGTPMFLSPDLPVMVIDVAEVGRDLCNSQQNLTNRGFIVDSSWQGFIKVDK